MNRLERFESPEAALRAAMQGERATLWTALPCIIQSFDAVKQTCTAQPAIQAQVRNRGGHVEWVTLPLLVDVPVVFPGGGGFTLTFPVAHGDEALVVFASRCIDAWWQSGGIGVQAEFRMHDLSDGFAFVGVKSQPRKLGGVSTNATQLRSDDGALYVELAGGHVANIVAPGGLNITGPVHVTGTITGTDTITAPLVVGTNNVTFGGKSGIGHTHSGVSSGPDNTGAPN